MTPVSGAIFRRAELFHDPTYRIHLCRESKSTDARSGGRTNKQHQANADQKNSFKAVRSRDMKKHVILGASIVVLSAFIAGAALYYLKSTNINQALAAEERSLALSEAILEVGGTPDAWTNRVFLPQRVIDEIVSALPGIERVVRLGEKDEAGHYDGEVVIRVDEVELSTEEGQLHGKLSVSARYEADRETKWWAGAIGHASLDTLLLALPHQDDKGNKAIRLHLIPKSVRPQLTWGPLSIWFGDFLATLIADGALAGWQKELIIPAPAINSDLDLDLGKPSVSRNKFATRGAYDLTLKINRDPLHRKVTANVPLPLSTGMWMLGGKSLDEIFSRIKPAQDVTEALILDRRRQLASRMVAFQKTDDLVYVRIDNGPILELADELRKPILGKITSSYAYGVIAKPTLLKDDLLGEVSLEVSPRGPAFLSGGFSIAPPDINWETGLGLTTALHGDAWMSAALHTHTKAGFVGGGIGNHVDLYARTSFDLTIQMKLLKQSVASGSAVVLLPEIGCKRIKIGITPTTPGDVFANAWLRMRQFRIDIERNVGGGRPAPSILISSVPTVYPFGSNEAPKPGDREYTKFNERGVTVSWDARDTVVGPDYLEITSGYKISPAVAKPGPISNEEMEAFKTALRRAIPEVPCEPEDNFILSSWDVELLNKDSIAGSLMDMYKKGVKLAEDAIKQVEKFYERPVDAVKDLPGEVLRQGAQATRDAIDAAKRPLDPRHWRLPSWKW
jgi:hypothetical protein